MRYVLCFAFLCLGACDANSPDLSTLDGAPAPVAADPSTSVTVADDATPIPTTRISSEKAMAIASNGAPNGFRPTSTLIGPAGLTDGREPVVYAVTLTNDEGDVMLRYVDLVTGEIYGELDELHTLDEILALSEGDTADLGAFDDGSGQQAWYRSCNPGWVCIRNPPSNIAFYSQRDPSWSGTRLGNSSLTIGSHGCLLTAYAMALREEGFGTRNPRDLNTLGIQRGCFSGALIRHQCLVDAAAGRATYRTLTVNQIWSHIASGKPVVAFGTSNCFTNTTHAQMIWGHDGARFWTKDPYYDHTQQDQSMCLSSVAYHAVN
jgi:hypothetical protein